MSHSPVFFDVCLTTQFVPMYVTQPRFLHTHTHTHTHTHRWQWDRPQAAVGPPTGGNGTAHRRQWGRPQAAVGPPTSGSEAAHRRQSGCPRIVVRPPTGGHYLQHRFVWLLLLDLLYELLPFFFTPNQVFVEHNMANATSYTYFQFMRHRNSSSSFLSEKHPYV